ncbi:hypothetical protein MJO29_011242 [Puccinia striiformis f. sp. tritici]|nr:hypothetical protein MJO29_011242 [Puccinia striiformis f. sp. tritici]
MNSSEMIRKPMGVSTPYDKADTLDRRSDWRIDRLKSESPSRDSIIPFYHSIVFISSPANFTHPSSSNV